MEYKKISELTTVVTGGTPSTKVWNYWNNGTIPWLQSGCCQNCDVCSSNNFITQDGYDNSSAKMMPKNTVMIALTGATAGKIGFLRFEACGNQSITGILPCNDLNQRFLYYFLISQRPKILNDCIGGAQLHISQAYVKNILIPILPLSRQNEIVDKLTKIEVIISLRYKQLKKLDELVKSRFVEMFGGGEYQKVALIDLIRENAGLSYGIVQPGDDGTGDMGVLRPVDIVDGKISTESIKHIDRSIGNGFKKTELTGNELLVTVRGTTGVTAITDNRFAGMNVTRGIAVIRYDPNRINPLYLNAYLNTDESQQYIQEHTRGATLRQINLSDLRIQEIITPPMTLQTQFADFVKQVDKSKFEIKQSLEKLELLKKALMQKYFG